MSLMSKLQKSSKIGATSVLSESSLFGDKEFIDTDRVLHTPIANVEELKFDIVAQLEAIDKKDDVIIVIDSIGNLASKKELEDAMNEKSVADMSRAKSLKGLFRMVTPYLAMKSIPLLAINHTYKEIGLFPKDIVSGGTGIMYSADNVWIIGRQQDKDGTEIQGYHFIVNVEKSRYVKERSKVPITVSWEGGVNKWSGLFDIAIEGNYIAKSGVGWYQMVDRETGELVGNKLRAKDIVDNDRIWSTILEKTDIKGFIMNKYAIGGKRLLNEGQKGGEVGVDEEDHSFGSESD